MAMAKRITALETRMLEGSSGTEMVSPAKEVAVAEIVGTIINVRKRLGKDVDEMCNLVLFLREKCVGKLGIYQQEFDNCCLAIYYSLRLHLVLYCGDTSVLRHKNLRKLGRCFKPEEIDNFSVEKRPADPGSKVLEIVSTQFLASKGTATLGISKWTDCKL